MKKAVIFWKPGTNFNPSCTRLLDALCENGYIIQSGDEGSLALSRQWKGVVEVIKNPTLQHGEISLMIQLFPSDPSLSFDLIEDDFTQITSLVRRNIPLTKDLSLRFKSRNRALVAYVAAQQAVYAPPKPKPIALTKAK